MMKHMKTIVVPGVLTAVGMGVVVVPHTIGLEFAKEATQAYKNGFPVPVASNIHNIFLEVKNDLLSSATKLPSIDITLERLNSIQPYTVFGFDMYRLGWLKSEYGGWLGVPEYFKYIGGCPPSNQIRANNKQVPWEAPAGKKLMESLSISEDAKQFAIARETLLLCKDETDGRFLNTIGNMTVSLMMGRGLHQRLNLGSRPLIVRGLIYSMVATFGVTFWFMINDALALNAERTADSAIVTLGERYVRAGVEYCESIVKRNLALRDILGEEGNSVYTACGNEQNFIRVRHVPIVERLSFFKEKLDEINKGNQNREAKA